MTEKQATDPGSCFWVTEHSTCRIASSGSLRPAISRIRPRSRSSCSARLWRPRSFRCLRRLQISVPTNKRVAVASEPSSATASLKPVFTVSCCCANKSARLSSIACMFASACANAALEGPSSNARASASFPSRARDVTLSRTSRRNSSHSARQPPSPACLGRVEVDQLLEVYGDAPVRAASLRDVSAPSGGIFRCQNVQDRPPATLGLLLNTAQRTGAGSPQGNQHSHCRQGPVQAHSRRRHTCGGAKPEEGQQEVSAKPLHPKTRGTPLVIGWSKVIPLGHRDGIPRMRLGPGVGLTLSDTA